jgi:hypothetical protein
MGAGQLPPPLSPFRSLSGIFIPVIVRAEIVDRQLRQVFVIFVPADSRQLGGLIEGSSLPKDMPKRFMALVKLLRLIFRARWDILEPRWSEVRFKQPPPDKCREIVRQVLSEYEDLNGELARLGLAGPDAFHELFDHELWEEIASGSKEWLDIVNGMRTQQPDNFADLDKALSGLRSNNATWMNIGARQFTSSVARYCRMV